MNSEIFRIEKKMKNKRRSKYVSGARVFIAVKLQDMNFVQFTFWAVVKVVVNPEYIRIYRWHFYMVLSINVSLNTGFLVRKFIHVGTAALKKNNAKE